MGHLRGFHLLPLEEYLTVKTSGPLDRPFPSMDVVEVQGIGEVAVEDEVTRNLVTSSCSKMQRRSGST
jgi:hypothetical protein